MDDNDLDGLKTGLRHASSCYASPELQGSKPVAKRKELWTPAGFTGGTLSFMPNDTWQSR